MRKPILDFARPQPLVRMQRNLGGVALLLAGALCAGWVVNEHLALQRQAQSREAELRQITRQLAPRPSTTVSRENLAAEIGKVNQAAAQLTIPWDNLFAAVESAQDGQVALLTFQPNFSKRELRLSGEAASFESLRRFSERLGQGSVLSEVRLLSHEMNQGAGGPVVKFELLARWRSGA